jgi:hypothetical protein
MKRIFEVSQEERKRISNLHESAIRNEFLMEQPYVTDKSNWDKFPCVMSYKGAKKTQLKDGSTAFFIGKEVYYNNGRKKLENGTMSNYSCNDEIFTQSVSTPAATETQTTTPVKKSLSNYVKEAQKLIGMPESEQDGKFGPKTLQALQDFIGKNKGAETPASVETMDTTGSVVTPDVA